MKKLIYSLFVVCMATTSFAQNEEIHNAKIIGSFELGNKEVTIVYDEVTGCDRKTSPHSKHLFTPNENVQIKISDNKQMAEIIKPILQENVYANKLCRILDERILTDEDIEQIGKIHNESLELAIDKFDSNSNNLKQNFKQAMIDVVNENYEGNTLWQGMQTDLDINLESLERNLSSDAFNIINIAIQESYNVLSVSDYKSFIHNLENTARGILNGKELDATLVTLCVLRYSAEFWMPESIGGSGIGDVFLDEVQAKAPGWLAADGAAAGCGMIGTAVTAALATGPVGWGFLVGVGVSSALASGWSALF